jgi:hypothetical protein
LTVDGEQLRRLASENARKVRATERQRKRGDTQRGDMSIPPVSSNVHGQLDAQIAQLIQCKPLPEHEVSALFSYGVH